MGSGLRSCALCAFCALTILAAPATRAVALDLSDVNDRYKDAMLHVESEGYLFNGEVEKVTGTGFVITKDGYAITANHVTFATKSNYKRIVVVVRAGSLRAAAREAKIIASDANDITLLKIDAGLAPSVTLGQSAPVKIGAPVGVLGFPLGYDLHVSGGVVSAKETPLRWHTDAAVNPGQSGAPVFDDSARVIGIVTAGAVTAFVQGYGSLPIEGIKIFAPIDVFRGGMLFTKYISTTALGTAVPPLSARRSPTLPRAYGVDERKSDPPKAVPDSRNYVKQFPAEPGHRIARAQFSTVSASHATTPEVDVAEGGKLVTVRFRLTSGPASDPWHAWLIGTLLTEQRRN
jgi:hypothetical protein